VVVSAYINQLKMWSINLASRNYRHFRFLRMSSYWQIAS